MRGGDHLRREFADIAEHVGRGRRVVRQSFELPHDRRSHDDSVGESTQRADLFRFADSETDGQWQICFAAQTLELAGEFFRKLVSAPVVPAIEMQYTKPLPVSTMRSSRTEFVVGATS